MAAMAFLPLSLSGIFQWFLVPAAAIGISVGVILLLSLAISHNSAVPKCRPRGTPAHLLVVLGSGGHTAEMFYMLQRMQLDPSVYTYRTYVVSSGDNFSARKAAEFESRYVTRANGHSRASDAYSIVTIPRARRVHQSYLTAPFSTLQCFWACLLVLRGLHPDQPRRAKELTSPYPDIILTNGPATAVCVIVAAKLLRFFHFILGFVSPSWTASSVTSVPKLRTIFVESWARVSTLSTSGVLLLPLADRFLVQWPALGGRRAWWGMRKTEYVGWLVL